jgi:acetate kinase
MATRSGSIDPGVLLHLARNGLSIDEIDAGLNHDGGLAGVSGVAGGVQAVIAAADAGDAPAALAVAIFVRGVAAAVGGMATALGGLDALVFSGGVGEHAASVRAAIVDRVAHLGAGHVLVIAAGEERLIAQQAAALLAADP